jgi:hypothetical protein
MIAILFVNAGALNNISMYGLAFFSIIFSPGLLIIFTRDTWNQDVRLQEIKEVEVSRGWLLTLMLIGVIIFNIIAVIIGYFSTGYIVSGELGSVILSLIEPTQIFFALAIWKWKKWGVYGLLAANMFLAGNDLIHSDYLHVLILRVFAPGILVYALRDKWNQFD